MKISEKIGSWRKKQNCANEPKTSKKSAKLGKKVSEEFSENNHVIFKYEEEYFPRVIVSIKNEQVN